LHTSFCLCWFLSWSFLLKASVLWLIQASPFDLFSLLILGGNNVLPVKSQGTEWHCLWENAWQFCSCEVLGVLEYFKQIVPEIACAFQWTNHRNCEIILELSVESKEEIKFERVRNEEVWIKEDEFLSHSFKFWISALNFPLEWAGSYIINNIASTKLGSRSYHWTFNFKTNKLESTLIFPHKLLSLTLIQ
jgi:hypothetical protein